jgi:hypothetical protein
MPSLPFPFQGSEVNPASQYRAAGISRRPISQYEVAILHCV